MHNKLISFLQLFRHLPEEDQMYIEKAFEFKVFKEGDYLFKGIKICRDLFFIQEGVLRIMVRNQKGKEVTHYFLNENHFCTILNSFTKELPAEESIQAACDVEVLAINKARLLILYEKIPYLKALIDEIIQQALIEKIQVRNAYLSKDSTTRYHHFMMKQADIALRVSLNDVASYLGITPQSLSRIRKNRH